MTSGYRLLLGTPPIRRGTTCPLAKLTQMDDPRQLKNGDSVSTTFVGIRQDRSARETPSVRYEVRPGCYVTLFDDGRTRFTIDPAVANRKVHHVVDNNSNLPGGKLIETK